MIKALLFDFSRTLLFVKDPSYQGKLNDLYRNIISKKGYNFFDYFTLNNELFNYLKPLKNKYTLAIYTTDIIQNDPSLKTILDDQFAYVFAANEMDITKKDPQGYLLIAKKLNKKPDQILFIDDQLVNLNAAKKAGLQTIQFISNKQLFNDLKNKLDL